MSKTCRSQKTIRQRIFRAEIGFDTAEKGTSEVSPKMKERVGGGVLGGSFKGHEMCSQPRRELRRRCCRPQRSYDSSFMSSSGKLDVISNAFRPDRFGPNVSAQQRSKGVHPTGYAAKSAAALRPVANRCFLQRLRNLSARSCRY